MSDIRRKELRQAYGFDDVAIVPGEITVNPELVDISASIAGLHLDVPILPPRWTPSSTPTSRSSWAAAAVSPCSTSRACSAASRTPTRSSRASRQRPGGRDRHPPGGLHEPHPPRPRGGPHPADRRWRRRGAVSVTPPNTKKLAPTIQEAGADILVVQSTVTTARHESRSLKGLVLRDLVAEVGIPVLVGNTVGYRAALELMDEGIAGLLVGVGPGAACTSREVLGIGVPQVTATIDCAAARDEFERRTGRRVPIITDGGIRTGGDVCKSFAAGADAVMIGSPFAGALEAPGRGYHWGMATPHAELPRGVRVHVGRHTSLDKLLSGPTSRTDGTENLAGALRTSMGSVGARTLIEMQQTEMIIAPAIKTEGKIYQHRRD